MSATKEASLQGKSCLWCSPALGPGGFKDAEPRAMGLKAKCPLWVPVSTNQSFYHVSQCPLAAQIWEPGTLATPAGCQQLGYAWSLEHLGALAGGKGMVVCGGGRVEGLLSIQWG